MGESLTEFLLERIAEDEATVREDWFSPTATWVKLSPAVQVWQDTGRPMRREDIKGVRVDRGRILAECAAKRRIVEDMYVKSETEGGGYAIAVDEALAHLALPYADHPDYLPEWRP